MRYRYSICDVFTENRFGGNQLAVLSDARGLSSEQMQKIAREFNFSETTFVLPSESGHTRHVRIFTPAREVPFAGHPNIGTAFALATAGEFGDLSEPTVVTFEQEAGVVPIAIRRDPAGIIRCELSAPLPLSLGEPVARDRIAAALSLEPADIVTEVHPPREASVGLPFLIVQVRPGALGRARADAGALRELESTDGRSSIHLYSPSGDDFDIRARMFAPLSGVPEDPATGSANCALVGLLTHASAARDGDFQWRISQGVEMGRPSILDARTQKRGGEVTAIRIGGSSVLFSEGHLDIEQIAVTRSGSGPRGERP